MKNYLLSLTKNCKLWKNESILVPPFLLSFTRALFEWARKYLSRVSMTVSQKITMVLHKKGVQSYRFSEAVLQINPNTRSQLPDTLNSSNHTKTSHLCNVKNMDFDLFE